MLKVMKKEMTHSDIIKRRICKLIKDDIFFDEDLDVWISSRDFSDIVDFAVGKGKLFLWYQNKKTLEMTINVLDLDTLELYEFDYKRMSTII